MLLTKEQIDLLTQEQAEKALRKIEREFKVDKPFHDYMTPELWNQLDDIANAMLYLEDRIAHIKMSENAAKANEARWANKNLTEQEE